MLAWAGVNRKTVWNPVTGQGVAKFLQKWFETGNRDTTGSQLRAIQALAEAQEIVFPEDIGMGGFHVRKHHTGEDVLPVFFGSPQFKSVFAHDQVHSFVSDLVLEIFPFGRFVPHMLIARFYCTRAFSFPAMVIRLAISYVIGWNAVRAIVYTMSSTKVPLDRSFSGRFNP